MTVAELHDCVDGYREANSPAKPKPPSEEEFLAFLGEEIEKGRA